jgi:molecular chaperone DnaK
MTKIYGIDLGTTNSLIAFHENKETTIIPDKNGDKILPSYLSFLDNDSVIVGKRAVELSKLNPKRSVFSIKRFMGLNSKDINLESELLPYQMISEDDSLKVKIDNKKYSPVEISAMILEELKKRAETYHGENVRDAVITVPAYFNDNQRSATQLAAKLADLNPIRIINEPTAAALAYGLNKKENATILVYDLGGGTFDVSILKLHNGIFEVLSTNGNTRLGGDDIDQEIINYFLKQIHLGTNIDSLEREALRKIAKEAKHRLSNETSLSITIIVQSKEYQVNINKDILKELIYKIINNSFKAVRKALKDSETSKEQLDEIILVGGSTKSPIVQEAIEDYFGKKPLSDINPDEVVAIGAAIQGAILAGEIAETVLLDVTPLSLGMETMGSVVEKFIMRNSKIPCEVTESFTTAVDGQSAVVIHILQGERELVEDNISLGKFILDGIEPMAAGLARIDVTFQLDQNGVLNVSATDTKSGKKQKIKVQPSSGLTDELVESMLRDSIFKAKEDFEKRMIIDKCTEANAIILSTQRALNENGHLLSSEEQEKINNAVTELIETSKSSEDRKVIESLIDSLDQLTEPFAEKIMNNSIKSALTNKRTEEII